MSSFDLALLALKAADQVLLVNLPGLFDPRLPADWQIALSADVPSEG